MAPGLVLDTNLYRDLTLEARRNLEQYGRRSISEGAGTAIWLARKPSSRLTLAIGPDAATMLKDVARLDAERTRCVMEWAARAMLPAAMHLVGTS
jgi:hypothetical protein